MMIGFTVLPEMSLKQQQTMLNIPIESLLNQEQCVGITPNLALAGYVTREWPLKIMKVHFDLTPETQKTIMYWGEYYTTKASFIGEHKIGLIENKKEKIELWLNSFPSITNEKIVLLDMINRSFEGKNALAEANMICKKLNILCFRHYFEEIMFVQREQGEAYYNLKNVTENVYPLRIPTILLLVKDFLSKENQQTLDKSFEIITGEKT